MTSIFLRSFILISIATVVNLFAKEDVTKIAYIKKAVVIFILLVLTHCLLELL